MSNLTSTPVETMELAKSNSLFAKRSIRVLLIQPPTLGEVHSYLPQLDEKSGGILVDYSCPELPGYESHKGTCPNASWFANRMINLPIWDGISRFQAEKTIQALQRLQDRYPDVFPTL